MSTIELKNLLISKIIGIDDEAFLSALNTILDSKKDKNDTDSHKIMKLSDQQKSEILKSQKEYLQGNYFENDTLNEEMEKWLREE